jgi:hypothetical protein
MTTQEIVDALYTIAEHSDYGTGVQLMDLALEIEKSATTPPLDVMADVHVAKIRAAGL